MSVVVKIVSSAGLGYNTKVKKLKSELEDEFGLNKLSIETEYAASISGVFDVFVNGELCHSHKGGDGFVDHESKLEQLTRAIHVALWRVKQGSV